MKFRFLTTTLFFFLAGTFTYGQSFDWSVSCGAAGSDVNRSMAVDPVGNVYVTGNFSGTVDFDPGPGTFTLTASGSSNIFVQKLDGNGNFLWAKAMTGTEISRPYSIVVDAQSNVYSTGFFSGTVDFDPGAPLLNLNSGSAIWRDYYVQKLDPNGDLVWAYGFGSGHEEIGYGLELDVNGDLLVVGTFSDTVDFDPGAGTTSLIAHNKDIFVQKLSASGNLVWAKSMTGTLGNGGDDTGFTVDTDASGNVYLGGTFAGEVDFDPGPGVVQLTNSDFDGFVEKLDANGNFVWVKQLACTFLSEVYDVHVTSAGEVLLTGIFMQTMDSDPGVAVANVTVVGGFDAYLMKLDASGDLVWFNQTGGNSDEYGRCITEDAAGNIYLGGEFRDTVDFDPSAGTADFYSAGNSDIFIQRLSASGAYNSLLQFGGGGADGGFGMEWANGSTYFAGYFNDTIDLDPYAGSSVHISNGSEDAFVVKLNSGVSAVQVKGNAIAVTAFPNPTNGKLFLQSENGLPLGQVDLMTMEGKIIQSENSRFSASSELDLSEIPAGVYLLSIRSDSGNTLLRIVRN